MERNVIDIDLNSKLKNVKSDRDKDILNAYFIQKMSIKEICKNFKTSDKYLYNLLDKYQLEKRETKGAKTLKILESNKELKYYLLGLIASDGYIYETRPRIEITLIKSDKKLLEDISILLYGKNRVIIEDDFSINGRARLFIYGKEIVSLYKKYGLYQNKSATMEIRYDLLEKNYIWHFIRGYFDGDGTYYTKAGRKKHNVVIKVDGNKNTMYSINKTCKDNNINSNVFLLNQNISFPFYRLQISNMHDSVEFIRKTYNNATIYLERKYNLINNLI